MAWGFERDASFSPTCPIDRKLPLTFQARHLVIYLAVLYQRHSDRIVAHVQSNLPGAVVDLIPPRVRA
jgi:hypothetical protein